MLGSSQPTHLFNSLLHTSFFFLVYACVCVFFVFLFVYHFILGYSGHIFFALFFIFFSSYKNYYYFRLSSIFLFFCCSFSIFLPLCARIIGRKKITDKINAWTCVLFSSSQQIMWSLEIHEENITCNVCVRVCIYICVCSRLL